MTRPALPSAADLAALADETMLTTDVHRGVVECLIAIPNRFSA